MKPRLAFVDHSFHKKSKCTVYLKELLSEYSQIDEYWDEGWNAKSSLSIESINDGNYDSIVLFQVLFSLKEIKKLKCKNITWIPMYDDVAERNSIFWANALLLPIKVICFSSHLHHFLSARGFDSKYFRYFVNPQFVGEGLKESAGRPLKLFFWQRTRHITLSDILKRLNPAEYDELKFHNVPDPGNEKYPITASEISHYKISVTEHFLNQSQYLDLIRDCQVYISPRNHEGIGMAFLEAMAMGKVPVALNRPTMNEYISSGVNGLLFDRENIELFQLENHKSLADSALHFASEGFKSWKNREPEFVEHILYSVPNGKKWAQFFRLVFSLPFYPKIWKESVSINLMLSIVIGLLCLLDC